MIKQRRRCPAAVPLAAPHAAAGQPERAEISAQIGPGLGVAFATVVAQPVPEKFRAIAEEPEGTTGGG